MKLAEIYELESQVCQAILANDEGRAQQVLNQLNIKRQHDPRTEFPFAKVQTDVWKAEISVGVIKAIFQSNLQEVVEEIDGRENELKNYVEKLLNVDLSKVRILRTKNDCDHSEGCALPCGATDHIVHLPPIDGGFVSADLLVHELGHTAEFTLRRASNEIEMVRSHKLFSEAIAHYCQYRYLLEFGTKAQRIGVIGSVTKDHLLLRALVATFTLADTPQLFHVDPILQHNALTEYRLVYSDEMIRCLLGDYEGKPLSGLYFFLVEARMGAILALHLINNGAAIRQLCTVKTDGTVRELLDRLGLNTDELLDFSQADLLLRKFIDGSM